MEVGAVKQAFNNEIILLKKNLNQAKIQTIHKLTRKAKTFMEKKLPENRKEKLKRKAESAVKEVLIIKKIKPRDIARFIVTHTGKLNDFLNKPIVDNDKACARLLLHKALQEKYKQIREKFVNISIKDLFMSRQERRKLKKEAREKQKNKRKGKAKSDTVNVEGEWDVEITNEKGPLNPRDDKKSDHNDESETDKIDDNDIVGSSNGSDVEGESENEVANVSESDESNEKLNNGVISKLSFNQNDSEDDASLSNESDREVSNELVTSKNNHDATKYTEGFKTNKAIEKNTLVINTTNKKSDKKVTNKNKNLNKKLEKRNFNRESIGDSNEVTKIADPFFITSTGENYMSLVEPRQPDEVKEVHKQGNRQYRRAVMFGHVPKVKPKKNNFETRNDKFNKQNSADNIFNKKNNKHSGVKPDFGSKDRRVDKRNYKDDTEPEKLHPSWEAKKKQSGILPFQGKKIVFDES